MAVGKALGAGVPIAAALFSERVAKAAAFGDHGSTYGGNLLACRAALVFLEELIDRDLIAHVASVGAHLERGLRAIAARHPIVREVRGAGLIWGLDLDRPALPVVEAALELGLLVNRTSDTVVRLLPPFVITDGRSRRGVRPARTGIREGRGGKSIVNASVTLRTASPSDVPAIHRLITDNLEVGHLLPRSIEDVERHVARFVVASVDDAVVGCAELAPLSGKVAEVRSLVVDEAFRGRRIGPELVTRARHDRDRQRLLDAVRVHARAVALRAHGLHDRAAHLGAREDRARLHGLRALPPLRSVRGDARPARRRHDRTGASGGDHPRHAADDHQAAGAAAARRASNAEAVPA